MFFLSSEEWIFLVMISRYTRNVFTKSLISCCYCSVLRWKYDVANLLSKEAQVILTPPRAHRPKSLKLGLSEAALVGCPTNMYYMSSKHKVKICLFGGMYAAEECAVYVVSQECQECHNDIGIGNSIYYTYA